ncbi:MAG: hypothetical protein HOV79_29055 [Hamadaea sp.]|nr:hypothetical protein [Hamadaea sp.]
MPSKKTYVAAGVLAAGSAAAVTAYAVARRRRNKAVDEELAVMIDEVEAELHEQPAVESAAEKVVAEAKGVPTKAQSSINDLLGAKPAFDA